MLTLYHASLSPCAQKVRLVLHEKQLAYESRFVNLDTKENLLPEYLALNPNGVVPTLIDDEVPIIESSIICEYLDDKFAEIPLRPLAPVGRAHLRLWAKRVDEKIHLASGILMFGAIVRRSFLHMNSAEVAAMLAKIPDPGRRERQADLITNGLDSARLPAAVKVLEAMADDIETATARAPWMLGEKLSIVDFLLAPYALVLENFELTKVFAARPAMAAWMKRVKQTRGYQGGITAYQTQEDSDKRALLLPSITPKLEPLFG